MSCSKVTKLNIEEIHLIESEGMQPIIQMFFRDPKSGRYHAVAFSLTIYNHKNGPLGNA